MDRQDYIEIILDHYEHPRNKGRMEDADISNVRQQAGAASRKRRVSFFGSIRD